jgi:putative PIN family toxin of toxin-antitoxin system
MIRAVLDTNVLVSAFLNPGRVPAQIVEAWRREQFSLCLSEPILAELGDVLQRPRVRRAGDFTEAQVREFLEALAEDCQFVDAPLPVVDIVASDPDDNVIIATALAGDADLIVSGDKDLLRLPEQAAFRIVTPAEFVEMLRREVRET